MNNLTYLPGMLFVRLSRKLRRKYYTSIENKEMAIVKNCMGNIVMKVDKNSYMGGSIYWSGFHHINEIKFLNSYLKKDMIFIDIGANQGELSLYAASKLSKGKVISFEPVSMQYEYFMNNIELNSFKNIELYKYGLSNEEMISPVFTSQNIDSYNGINEGLSTLYKSDDKNIFEENIELKIFDNEFEGKISRIDFIKIDIEGAELFALKGMKKHIEKFKPVILIEMSEEAFNSAGYSIDDVTLFLNTYGYKVYKIFRGKLIKHIGIFDNWGNYIFKIDI